MLTNRNYPFTYPTSLHLTMSIREIQTNGGLPTLNLPPGALSPNDRQYDYNPATEPSAIEPIEHKIRLDIIEAGLPEHFTQFLGKYSHYRAEPGDPDPWDSKSSDKPLALQYSEHTIQEQWESEQKYFNKFESDAVLNAAPAYLADVLRRCREKKDPKAAVEREQKKREKWYKLMSWKNLYPVFKQDNVGDFLKGQYGYDPLNDSFHGPNHNETSFVGILVIPDKADREETATEYGVNKEYVRKEQEFATHHSGKTDLPTPTDYGIRLPAPLLMGEYPNGSEYLFIPWSSGLVCQGPFKQSKPFRVTCKHEVLASMVLSKKASIFLPIDKGIDVPARARRFVDPKLATTHTPKTASSR